MLPVRLDRTMLQGIEENILTVDKSCVVVICSAEGYPGEYSVSNEVTIEDRHNTSSKRILNYSN